MVWKRDIWLGKGYWDRTMGIEDRVVGVLGQKVLRWGGGAS